jgi:hypothetical protein
LLFLLPGGRRECPAVDPCPPRRHAHIICRPWHLYHRLRGQRGNHPGRAATGSGRGQNTYLSATAPRGRRPDLQVLLIVAIFLVFFGTIYAIWEVYTETTYESFAAVSERVRRGEKGPPVAVPVRGRRRVDNYRQPHLADPTPRPGRRGAIALFYIQVPPLSPLGEDFALAGAPDETKDTGKESTG